MSALPNLPRVFEASTTIFGAYNTIKALERSSDTPEKLILARILGYLILEGPNDQARVKVAQEVNSCKTDDDKNVLGKTYMQYFLRVFRKTKGRTPAHPSQVSHPSFNAIQARLRDKLIRPPEDYQTAKRDALIRDKHRCPISGAYDRESLKIYPELRDMVLKAQVPAYGLHCSHIFPDIVNKGVEEDPSEETSKTATAKANYAASRFGYTTLSEGLNGKNIHRLDNILILDPVAHDHFDHLELWFEPIPDRENTYCIKYSDVVYSHNWKTEVTFTTPDPIQLPVPNTQLLELHAACARVARLSGAGEYIKKIMMELGDGKVLAKDGGSALALEYALIPWGNAEIRIEA